MALDQEVDVENAEEPGAPESRRLLVELLREAAKLEHCLLDAYLYAACSLRSTPEELAEVAGQENRRRAVQFERVRAWKQSLLSVAHEEMLHLHYVECLLRALGEAPCFELPERDPGTGDWVIPNWDIQLGVRADAGAGGVQVPVEPVTAGSLRRLVLYESSDAFQDEDPWGPGSSALFRRLARLELDLHLEGAVYHLDEAQRTALTAELDPVYEQLPPFPAPAAKLRAAPPEALPPVEALTFRSIADFYLNGVLPLYEEAFELGWVRHTDRNLADELADPSYAAEGFLPIGPIYRDKNFERFSTANTTDPLRHYRNVADIVREIVEEGEGATNFAGRAHALLDKVSELGGARAYLRALLEDRASPAPTPRWLADGELLRQSHLYRFVIMREQFSQEQELAAGSGVAFDAARTPLEVGGSGVLARLARALPAQFNACYLVLVAWLARMYEIREWSADKPRRLAIEMLASWPLMSLAVRPFLELASFFPVDRSQLFQLTPDALPLLPVQARELHQLYAGADRSEETLARMDYLAVRVLSAVAGWARAQERALAGTDLPATARAMISARLAQLGQLDEFEKQFSFRVHGGYSGRLPDLAYQGSHRDGGAYEESPTMRGPEEAPGPARPVFRDSLVLRLRFSGSGLVQLATDPDPPMDEVGCTGTQMLHAADRGRWLDRSLVWQDHDPGRTIRREPEAALPRLGVDVVEAALLVAGGSFQAGYVPLQVMQSRGAVQASGVQQVLQVHGLLPLVSLGAGDVVGEGASLGIDLLDKGGAKAFLNGVNHLVWQDGEPIDPFVLAVSVQPAAGDPGLGFSREVFNEGRSILAMSPLQRLYSSRQPCGFDFDRGHVPAWARASLSADQQALAGGGAPPAYLEARAAALGPALAEELASPERSQAVVDRIVSFAERLLLVSVPRSTTVAWLGVLLHYGHTVSGPVVAGPEADALLSALGTRTGLGLQLRQGDGRKAPNGRWLVRYTKAMMDTDALADVVFGELYVPLVAVAGDEPVRLGYSWRFPATVAEAVAAYACHFDRPFWADFQVDGDVRRLDLPGGGEVVESLEAAGPDHYEYRAIGIPGTTEHRGSFTLRPPEGGSPEVVLSWEVAWGWDDADALVAALVLVASAAADMEAALRAHFGPSIGPPARASGAEPAPGG